MATTQDILRIAHAELLEAIETIRGMNRPEALERVQLTRFEVSERMTIAAGKATVGGPNLGRIKLSGPIFRDPANPEWELRNTIRHELAHVALPHGEHHGPGWKAMAIALGDTGDRCHELKVTRRAELRLFIFVCSECGEEVRMERRRRPSNLDGGRHRRHGALCGPVRLQP